RHTRFSRDWSSDVCSSDLPALPNAHAAPGIGGLIGGGSQASAKEEPQSNAQPSADERKQRLLSQAEETRQRLTDLKAELAGAPKEISEAQRTLSKLVSEDNSDLPERL